MKMNQICVVISMLGGAFLGANSLGVAMGQSTSRAPLDPPVNGVRRTDPGHHAFTNATVHMAPAQSVPHAGLVFSDGVISWVGSLSGRTPMPTGAMQHDATGLHIYPGLIEPFIEVDEPTTDDGNLLTHWNPMVTPQHVAAQGPGVDEDDKEALRKLGFVAAHITPKTGVFRGLSGVVSLAQTPDDPSQGQPPVYRDHVANVLSFDRTQGKPDGSGYPVSHMGAMALIRQTLIDSDWQRSAREAGDEIPFNSLDAIIPSLPLIFDVGNPLHALLADGVADEFERDAIVVGDGREYQHLDAIAAEGRPMIVPLRFPAKPDVSSVGMIEALSLKDLMAWEQAPTNARRLIDAGLDVAITSSKTDGRAKFHKNLRKAIEHGLSEDQALAALTTTPAAMLGLDDRLGTLAVGKIASFIVTDGPLFAEKTKILEVWIDGYRHEINKPEPEDLAGSWSYSFGTPGSGGTMTIDINENGKVKLTAQPEMPGAPELVARTAKIEGRRLSYTADNPNGQGVVVGTVHFAGDRLFGTILRPTGESLEYTGSRLGDLTAENAENTEEQNAEEQQAAEIAEIDNGPNVPETYGFPFGGYALESLPESQTALFTNATIWTSAPQGILENAWVMIDNGKIARLGTGVAPRGRPNMRIIDCEGKHITPGLIDAHSHTGLFAGGVNEGSQACTSEVRIHDSLDPSHINWYRQLAAGVTTVNSLHGSANPIGGQNAIHKVRWGTRHPDDMLMQGAKPGIKFALGENVKQSNWGDDYTKRYPQSRMGVETFIRDRFIAAREYADSQRATKGRSDAATKGAEYADATQDQDIPGPRRLATSDGPGPRRLSGQRGNASRGTLRAHHPDASLGHIRSVEHRRGPRPPEPDGLSQIPADRAGIAGRTGDAVRAGRLSQNDQRTTASHRPSRRDRSHTTRSHQVPRSEATSTLTTHVSHPKTPSSLRRSVPSSLPPPRRDLELEALAEILAGDRLIHCHSYRQDEILMLCRIAEEFGFKIGSFQHVLEGYKVAEAIKEHALGASCFSDWWAYKVEVQDAIPYNGPIMHDVGVVVSYNSDSDELARRLNTEAAKAVKYGDIDPAEALKFVTLNPAIQLAIDDRVGSIEPGKDADLAIWSANPLSSLSVCEATWIDGREYFSLEKDAAHRERIESERQRILAKLLKDDKKESEQDDVEKEDNDEDSEDAPSDPDWRLRDRLSLQWLDNLADHDHDLRGDCGCTADAWLHQLIHE